MPKGSSGSGLMTDEDGLDESTAGVELRDQHGGEVVEDGGLVRAAEVEESIGIFRNGVILGDALVGEEGRPEHLAGVAVDLHGEARCR